MLSDRSKEILLRLYNGIWEVGWTKWKEWVIVPVWKPGKEPSLPGSYRPIALTSHVGKNIEKWLMKD